MENYIILLNNRQVFQDSESEAENGTENDRLQKISYKEKDDLETEEASGSRTDQTEDGNIFKICCPFLFISIISFSHFSFLDLIMKSKNNF